MSVIDERVPYEVLIRFGADGAPQGAQVQYRRRIVVDGEVVQDLPLPAEPLTLAGDFPLSGVMEQTTREALVALAAAHARIGDLEQESKRLRTEVERLGAELAALR